MDIIELKAPSPEYAADIWRFRQEILEKDAGSKDQFAGCGGLEKLYVSGGMDRAYEAW